MKPVRTQAELARRIGIARETVSRALAGHPLVAGDLKKKVLDAAEKYGYQPNAAARAIKGGSTGLVGVLTTNAPGRRMHHPFAYEIMLGINERLAESGHVLTVVRIVDVKAALASQSRAFRERMLDGLIVADVLPDDVVARLEKLVPTCVWVDSNVWRPERCVRRDERHAGRAATRALVDAGYRRLLWLGVDERPGSHYSLIERYEGARRAAAAAGVELDTYALNWGRLDEARDDLRRMLAPDVGVVAYADNQAQWLVHAMAEDRLTPPHAFGLSCASDTFLVAKTWPTLTRVTFDRHEMGRCAADMMCELLAHSRRKQPSVKLKGKVHVGATVRARA